MSIIYIVTSENNKDDHVPVMHMSYSCIFYDLGKEGTCRPQAPA